MTDCPDALPPGWCWVALEDVSRLVTGGTPPGKEAGCYGDGTPFFKPTDLNAGRFVADARQYLTPHGASFLEVVPAGSVLITCIGATIGKTGLAAVACATNQQINAAVPMGVEPEFLYWFVLGPGAQIWILQNASATTLPILNKGRLARMPVAVAPINEQRRIVAKLETLQSRSRRAREALDAVPPLLEKLRQSILAAAFRGDLTKDWRAKNKDVEPARKLLERIRAASQSRERRGGRGAVASARAAEARPAIIPSTWAVASLEDVAPLQAGYAFRSSEFTTNGVRLLRGTNLVPDSTRWDDVVCIDPARISEFVDYELQTGDIVIAMDRPIISSGIKVARLAPEDVPALLLQRVGRFRIGHAIDAAYLFHFVRSLQFVKHISGQATGTQLPHISGTDVGAVLIPIPPLEEQAVIAKRCDDAVSVLADQAAAAARSHRRLEALDRSVLAKAFRGELVPQDPNDEPAEAMLARLQAVAAPVTTVAPKRRKLSQEASRDDR